MFATDLTIMKKIFSIYFSLFVLSFAFSLIIVGTGCANIVPPGGGPRDSLPPVLVSATPADSVTNFTVNRINLTCDEFVEV